MNRTRLKKKSGSETALVKESIQALVREIVILRDGGCILRDINQYDFLENGEIGIGHKRHGVPRCNGFDSKGQLIYQADHLITRSNSATFSDTRLIVAVCKGHHGWKKWNEQRYNEIVREILPSDRVVLWDRCHAARYKPVRMGMSDWRKEEAALRSELAQMRRLHPQEATIHY